MKLTFIPYNLADYGSGYVHNRMPESFDPVYVPVTFFHDLFEHFEYDGSYEDELMALGAMHHIRWEGGYWHMQPQKYIPEIHRILIGEITPFWERMDYPECFNVGDPFQHKRWGRLLQTKTNNLSEEAVINFSRTAELAECFIDSSVARKIYGWLMVGQIRSELRSNKTNMHSEMLAHVINEASLYLKEVLKDAPPRINLNMDWNNRTLIVEGIGFDGQSHYKEFY